MWRAGFRSKVLESKEFWQDEGKNRKADCGLRTKVGSGNKADSHKFLIGNQMGRGSVKFLTVRDLICPRARTRYEYVPSSGLRISKTPSWRHGEAKGTTELESSANPQAGKPALLAAGMAQRAIPTIQAAIGLIALFSPKPARRVNGRYRTA